MSDLPHDLVEEILSRVPATSLKRLRSTCKRWHALFKDRSFTEKHFRNAPKQSLLLAMKVSNFFLVNVSLDAPSPSIEIKVALSLKNPHSSSKEVIIYNIFHCDGLLLCTTNMNDRIVVWNPCSGETRWIQTEPESNSYSRFALGHDNNKLCHAYKILRFYRRNHIYVFEIYELSSHSWRVLDDIALDRYIEETCVSLKGNSYWRTSDNFLVCFDFRRERFRRLCLPTFQNHGRVCLSVIREEQLSVLHKCYNTSKMDIWVTNKIDTDAALWTKSFTVDLHNDFDKLTFRFFIDEENKVVVCCNYELGFVYTLDKYNAESSSVVSSTVLSWLPLLYSYVPSLVQIQQK